MKKKNKSALRRAMDTLVKIEEHIYIVAINGPEIQQEARLTLARFSRALAQTGGGLVDAYAFSGVASRWQTLAAGAAKWTVILAMFGSLASGATLISLVRGETLPAAVFAFAAAACAAVFCARHFERRVYESVASNAADQLLEFERMMLWLDFDTTNLSAMKQALRHFRNWESLRAEIDRHLKFGAIQILTYKDLGRTLKLDPDTRTQKVREAEDDFFPFWRRLAACGLADAKVDGYFDRARAELAKPAAPLPPAAVAT